MGEIGETAGSAKAPIHEVSADITARQAIYESHYAYSRTVGRMRFMQVWPIVGSLIGTAIGIALTPTINAAMFLINPAIGIILMWLPTAITVFLSVAGFALGIKVATDSYHRRYMLGMYERGMPSSVMARYIISDEAFVFDTSRIVHTTPWVAVLEIAATPRAWLISADMSNYVLPKTAFADPEAEREFIAEILEHLSPAARERSVEARALIEG